MKFCFKICFVVVLSLPFSAQELRSQTIGFCGGTVNSPSLHSALGLNGSPFRSKIGQSYSSSSELLALQVGLRAEDVELEDCNKFRPLDALMHAAASGIMQLGFQYLYEEKFGLSKNLAAVLATGSTMSVGVMKEFWDDKQDFNCFSSADIFMNGVGALTGLTIVFVF